MREKFKVAKGQRIKNLKINLICFCGKEATAIYNSLLLCTRCLKRWKKIEKLKIRKKFKNPLDLMIFEMMDKAFKKKKSKRGRDERKI